MAQTSDRTEGEAVREEAACKEKVEMKKTINSHSETEIISTRWRKKAQPGAIPAYLTGSRADVSGRRC